MNHEVDWSKFPKPWDRLGPELQAKVHEDVWRIREGFNPRPPATQAAQSATTRPYPKHF